MRAVIQAVSSASVRVNGGEPRPIGPGLVILLGVKDTDTLDIVPKLAEKCANLRVFPDDMAIVETDMAAAFRQLEPRLLRQVDFITDAAFRDDDASVGAHFRQPPFYISDHGVFSPCLSGNTRMAYRGPA